MNHILSEYVYTDTRPYSMTILFIIGLLFLHPKTGVLVKKFVKSARAHLDIAFTKIKILWSKLEFFVTRIQEFLKLLVGGAFMIAIAIPYLIFEFLYLPFKSYWDFIPCWIYSRFKEQLWWIITIVLACIWIIAIIIGLVVITDFLNYGTVIVVFLMKNILLVLISGLKKVLGVIFGEVLKDYTRFIDWQMLFRNETQSEFKNFVKGKNEKIKLVFKPIEFWFLGIFYILNL